MNKILEILSKLGILKYGGTAGTYKNEAAPSEFEYMSGANRESSSDDESGVGANDSQEKQQESSANLGSPSWMIVASWVLGALFWLVALGAFVDGANLVGFWMALAGLVTVHHTNKLLAKVGVDLSKTWRAIVVLVCLLVVVVTI
jgi:hypothetical protein